MVSGGDNGTVNSNRHHETRSLEASIKLWKSTLITPLAHHWRFWIHRVSVAAVLGHSRVNTRTIKAVLAVAEFTGEFHLILLLEQIIKFLLS